MEILALIFSNKRTNSVLPTCLYQHVQKVKKKPNSTYDHHQMKNTDIKLIYSASKVEESLFSQQKSAWGWLHLRSQTSLWKSKCSAPDKPENDTDLLQINGVGPECYSSQDQVQNGSIHE